MNCLLQFPFRDVLDVLVNRQNYIVSRLGLLFHAAEPFAAGIDRNQHLSRLALQLPVVFALNPAQSFIVHSYVAENLRRQLAFRIGTPGLFLEVDAAQIHGAYTITGLSIHLARYPAKGVRCLEAGQQFPRIRIQHPSQQAGGGGLIRNFAGHGKH